MHTGQITKGLKPSWEPLVAVVGRDVVPGFMWMYALRLDDGAEVHAYKTIATRQYLHLAAGPRAFAGHGGNRYEEISVNDAVAAAFAGWEEAVPLPRNGDAIRALLEHRRSAAVEAI